MGSLAQAFLRAVLWTSIQLDILQSHLAYNCQVRGLYYKTAIDIELDRASEDTIHDHIVQSRLEGI